jgi:hypothetical protein
MPLSLTDCTACPGLELLSFELLANPAAVDVLVLNVHKTLSRALSHKEGMGQRTATPFAETSYYAYSMMWSFPNKNHPNCKLPASLLSLSVYLALSIRCNGMLHV